MCLPFIYKRVNLSVIWVRGWSSPAVFREYGEAVYWSQVDGEIERFTQNDLSVAVNNGIVEGLVRIPVKAQSEVSVSFFDERNDSDSRDKIFAEQAISVQVASYGDLENVIPSDVRVVDWLGCTVCYHVRVDNDVFPFLAWFKHQEVLFIFVLDYKPRRTIISFCLVWSVYCSE